MNGSADSTVISEEERQVVAYLQAHPEFFSSYPELLRDIVVPHSCGEATSLVEYQISVLREQSSDLRGKMHELIRNARDNEDLALRMHRLTLGLLECPSADEVFTVLYQTLREEFHADVVSVRLFANAAAVSDQGLGEFLGGDTEVEALFRAVLESGQPVCGRIKGEHIDVLFPAVDVTLGSGALVPLSAVRGNGILAIGSTNPQRFQASKGTVFLRQLGEVVSRVINPHLAAN